MDTPVGAPECYQQVLLQARWGGVLSGARLRWPQWPRFPSVCGQHPSTHLVHQSGTPRRQVVQPRCAAAEQSLQGPGVPGATARTEHLYPPSPAATVCPAGLALRWHTGASRSGGRPLPGLRGPSPLPCFPETPAGFGDTFKSIPFIPPSFKGLEATRYCLLISTGTMLAQAGKEGQ